MSNLDPTTLLNSLQRIEVFTRWLGFADPPLLVAKLVISPGTDHFVRERFPDDQTDELQSDTVAQLLFALSHPDVPDLDANLCGLPESALRAHYSSLWTDDSPGHLVRITLPNDRSITIRTDAQYAFMLPFLISDSESGRNARTFDPRLSRAIAGLMPDGYLEKQRLEGRLGLLEHDLATEAIQSDPGGRNEADHPESDLSENNENVDTLDDFMQILGFQEAAGERQEAERTGNLSNLLLKRWCSADDVRDFLAQGADPNAADDAGQTALMHAAWPPFDREKFRLLVEAGADVEARRNDGYTGLHIACAGGESRAAMEWLRAGADVAARAPEGATPLMLASRWPEIVKALLLAGADVNAVDDTGRTALVYAVLNQCCIRAEDQLDAIRAIIDAKPELNQRDRAGITPLGHAKRALARVRLEEEVTFAFDGPAISAHRFSQVSRRLAEVIVRLLKDVGERDP